MVSNRSTVRAVKYSVVNNWALRSLVAEPLAYSWVVEDLLPDNLALGSSQVDKGPLHSCPVDSFPLDDWPLGNWLLDDWLSYRRNLH